MNLNQEKVLEVQEGVVGGWGLRESVTHHMCGYLTHTYMSRICTPPPSNSTTHKDTHGDVSRSQDRDSLHWATCICLLKVTARHTMPPTLGQDFTAKIKWPCSWPSRVGSWAKSPGKGRENWDEVDKGLNKGRVGRPSEKGRGCWLNRWVQRPHLASPSRRRVGVGAAGCSRQAGRRGGESTDRAQGDAGSGSGKGKEGRLEALPGARGSCV